MDDYLERLPPALRRQGSVSRGEIELVARTGDSASGDSENQVSSDCGIVYENDYFLVVQDRVRFPSGRQGTYARIIEKASLTGNCGTVIVPVAQDRIGFIHIFRHATRAWEWELPRGFQEAHLSPEENALTEIREELGVEATSVRLVGRVKPNTGLLAGQADVFVARLPDSAIHAARGQADEAIRLVRFVAPSELDGFLREQVTCGFSLSAILLARLHGELA